MGTLDTVEEPLLPSCVASFAAQRSFTLPMPGLDDEEGPHLPEALPPVVDAHVHLFPDRLFDAIWKWFDTFGWPIRYRLRAPDVISFLFARGVERIVALHYAHRPGIARGMNKFVAELSRSDPRIVGVATVFPGEPGATAILEEAFAEGLSGVKLHSHVQCVAADDAPVHEVYEACARAGKPVIIHAGREPTSPGYACDPHKICGVSRIEAALRDHPGCKIVVPHLGADELDGYMGLLEKYDNLWLDTTMAIADYLPLAVPPRMLTMRPDRVLFGTDFPNLPYAWDREIKQLLGMKLPEETLATLLGGAATALYGLQPVKTSAGV